MLFVSSLESHAAAVLLSERKQARGSVIALVDQARALPKLTIASEKVGKRRALVIGNDKYAELNPLDAAVSDSITIGKALTELGFEVTQLEDQDVRSFDRALSAFYKSFEPGDVAFFFLPVTEWQ